MKEFILELGSEFAFIGSEYKLGDYKCDNIKLNAYVVIKLKIIKLKHINIGQIKFYMNKTIGITFFKEYNEIVKYIINERLFMSIYKILN